MGGDAVSKIMNVNFFISLEFFICCPKSGPNPFKTRLSILTTISMQSDKKKLFFQSVVTRSQIKPILKFVLQCVDVVPNLTHYEHFFSKCLVFKGCCHSAFNTGKIQAKKQYSRGEPCFVYKNGYSAIAHLLFFKR